MSPKELRENAGISVGRLARILQLPQRSLEQWEEGERSLPPYIEKRILEELAKYKK